MLIEIFRIKELNPQSLFWAAVEGLRNGAPPEIPKAEAAAFFRRVALISLCGGVTVHLLDKVDFFNTNRNISKASGCP